MDRLKGILLNGHMSYTRWHAAQQFGVPLRGRVLSIALFEALRQIRLSERHSDMPRRLFLIENGADLLCQCIDAEGLLQEGYFGIQNAVANHDIVCVAALK
jgi:hypothetical protein